MLAGREDQPLTVDLALRALDGSAERHHALSLAFGTHRYVILDEATPSHGAHHVEEAINLTLCEERCNERESLRHD